ncbi:MAG: hypothetical protein E5W39_04850 [Mesorhizobium sp.]|nr:MAG: hypothetical protein E5W39_04850 [Mesorhizobium sp.]TIY05021.1 MAG: hypothetical protein E5V22_09085 [Mesorhizobium sp.]
MLAGGSAAVDHVLGDDFFQADRERAPSAKKIALIAITVFVRPHLKTSRPAATTRVCLKIAMPYKCRQMRLQSGFLQRR